MIFNRILKNESINIDLNQICDFKVVEMGNNDIIIKDENVFEKLT